jgi:hypothetical protein
VVSVETRDGFRAETRPGASGVLGGIQQVQTQDVLHLLFVFAEEFVQDLVPIGQGDIPRAQSSLIPKEE